MGTKCKYVKCTPSQNNSVIKPLFAMFKSGKRILFRKSDCTFMFAFAGMLFDFLYE